MTIHHWEKGPTDFANGFARYLQSTQKILDIGCGEGRNTRVFAAKGCESWGVDIKREQIARAEAILQAPNLHFLVGDVRKLPFEDHFFDAVFSVAVLHDIALDEPAAEIYRVVRKNGVVFLMFILNTVSPDKTEQYQKEENILTVYKKHFEIISLTTKRHIKDTKTTPPHEHDFLIMVLKPKE